MTRIPRSSTPRVSIPRVSISIVAAAFTALGWMPAGAVIDPFTTPQGPFTVGPGEEITPEQSILLSPEILGGFRGVAPVMGDDAPAGSTTTLSIGGGLWDCVLDVSVPDPVNSNGGCSTGWDRGDGPVFDFSMVDSFDVDVIRVDGAATLSLQAVDVNEALSIGPVEGVQQGLLQIPRSGFFPVVGGGVDWTAIDNLSLVVINENGDDARVTLGAVGASGVIPGAQTPPPGPSDDDLGDTVSGNWFNPARSGEGCQLTREGDGVTFILTCYVYREGDQVWMIGTGVLVDGSIISDDMVITEGANFGAGFDPDDVIRIPFGTVTMDFVDCNTGSVTLSPVVDGFESVLLPMQRIVPVDCGEGVPDPVNSIRAGNWYDPGRSGEGFQLAVEGTDGLHVLTFYTYLNGQPAWLIATGTIEGNRIVFADAVITSGTGFGSAFDPDDVVRTPFGTLTMEFQDCNNSTMLVESTLPEFGDLNLDLTRIVQGSCGEPAR